MDEWSRCTEGFAGVKKLSRIINVIPSQETDKRGRNWTEEAESTVSISCKDSPDQKKRVRRWRNCNSSSSKAHVPEKVSACLQPTWKPEAFLEDFKGFAEGDTPQQSLEIQCTSSSSSENNSGTEEDNGSKLFANFSGKKRIEKNKRRCKRSIDGTLIQCANNSTMKNKVDPSGAHSSSESHAINPVQSLLLQKMNALEKPCPQNISNGKRCWTVSSFELLDQTLIISRSQSAEQLATRRTKSDVRKENQVSKPKVRRRLHKELRQNSPGLISEVESDSDGQEDCQTVKQQYGERRQGANRIVEDSFFIHHSYHRQMLSFDEISPALSPAENVDEEGISPSSPKDSQMTINSESSCQSSLQQPKNTIKASDWVSVLQRQSTPVKGKEIQGMDHEDSAKKKKKFASGSLANRLFQIQQRLKSSVRMWYHSAKTGGLTDKEAKSITVQVKSVEKLFSLYLCNCQIICDHEKGKICQVFFSRDRAEYLSLKVGVLVRIYPPWQQLETSAGERTFLCTDFVHVASCQETLNTDPAESSHNNTSREELHVRAVWDCPCAKDSRLPCSSCPAVKCPNMVFTYQQIINGNFSRCQVNRPTEKGMVKFQSVHCSSPHWALDFLDGSYSVPVNKASVMGRTLQESKELLNTTSDPLPSFSATVLRVFVQMSADHRHVIRHRLLLVDSGGTAALATLPPIQALLGDEQTDQVRDGSLKFGRLEGKTCTCHGFTLSRRITCDQDSGLFSVLAHAWPFQHSSECESQVETDSASFCQGDVCDDSQEISATVKAAPNFAYILQADPDSRQRHFEIQNPNQVPQPGQKYSDSGWSPTITQRKICWRSLHDALKNVTGDRVTFVAKISFCYRDENSGNSSNSLTSVMVYDQEVDSNGHTVLHTVHLGNYGLLGRVAPSVCLFRDVCWNQDALQCDVYSLILPQQQWSSWGIYCLLDHADLTSVNRLSTSSLKVPKLTRDAAEGTVVSLEGHVHGVDEESACVLEECCVCGSDLIVPDTGPMHCTVCNKNVQKSVSVMRMAAFLTCSGFDPEKVVVKVQLAQKTIEKILPAEADDDGYDVDQVIGKSVACGACLVEYNAMFVSNSSQMMIFLRELEFT
ncbi:hypothetical protein RRG08_058797 [Elysia crispata]|uniref:Uncharacterized protein n=1 Tax=Elysia crispata TaxID=231223 RepID=A0AAE0YWH4_9GAST|nr:hypothetical protein RRG08_058797 [Elysia crispata]